MKEQPGLADRGHIPTFADINERLPNDSTVSWTGLLISDSLLSPFTYLTTSQKGLIFFPPLNRSLLALLISFIATLGCSFC